MLPWEAGVADVASVDVDAKVHPGMLFDLAFLGTLEAAYFALVVARSACALLACAVVGEVLDDIPDLVLLLLSHGHVCGGAALPLLEVLHVV